MNVTPTALPDVLLLTPTRHYDSRGWFQEAFRQTILEEAIGAPINFVQENESFSYYGVLRGLHFQRPPHAQSKLVRVTEGRIMDVAVDLRKDSPTFCQHISIELDSESGRQLFIPKDFAHGFVVLSRQARVLYKVDAYYAPDAECGLSYNDPDLAIDWPVAEEELKISDKDRQWPTIKQLNASF